MSENNSKYIRLNECIYKNIVLMWYNIWIQSGRYLLQLAEKNLRVRVLRKIVGHILIFCYITLVASEIAKGRHLPKKVSEA